PCRISGAGLARKPAPGAGSSERTSSTPRPVATATEEAGSGTTQRRRRHGVPGAPELRGRAPDGRLMRGGREGPAGPPVATTSMHGQMSTPQPLSRRDVLIVFGGLLLVMLLGALDQTIVATALPTIVGELGGVERLAWVVTAYLLAQTVVTPIYGKLGDLYGRKVVLQAAVLIFLLGSALCGLSASMEQLILFRGIQGLGGGGLIVTTQAVVGDIVSPRERGRYQGIFGAVFGFARVAGPLVAADLTPGRAWRRIFCTSLPRGLLALGVIAATLPRREERVRRTVDYAGAA